MEKCVVDLQCLAQGSGAFVTHLMARDVEGGEGGVERYHCKEGQDVLLQLHLST